MKKVFCLIMVFMLVMSPAVYAGAADEFADLYSATSKVSSASGKITFTTTLNEPLRFLETIPVEGDIDIDFQLLVEELIGATTEMEYAYSISDDKKKMDISLAIAFDTPIAFNEEFRLDAWTKIRAWIQFDMTNPAEPVYQLIFKVPFDKKYLVMDYSSMLNDSLIPIDLALQAAEEMETELMDVLLRYAKVQKKNAEYIISLEDDNARTYLAECLELYRNFMNKTQFSHTEDSVEMENVLQHFHDTLAEMPLLGEKGIEIKVSKNASGFIQAEVEQLHLHFNIFDLLTANGQSTKGLTREQGVVDLMLVSSVSYENQNRTDVTIPVLNDENSTLVFDGISISGSSRIAKTPPLFRNNRIYYPIEEMANQIGSPVLIEETQDGYAFTYSNESSAIVTDNSIKLLEAEYSEEYTTDVPSVVFEDDILYCTEDLLYPMDIISTYVIYDKNRNAFYTTYDYYVAPEEEPEFDMEDEYEYDYDLYIPEFLHYSFHLDRNLYCEDDMMFMPVYEFVSSLFDGEFSFGNHSITYTASEENHFDIQTFSASADDLFVTINGEQYALTHKVTDVNGVLNIPFSFAENLGLDGNACANQYLGNNHIVSNCSFSMLNPEYRQRNQIESMYERLHIWISSDQVPCIEDGEVYIPLYDLLQEMYYGEFSFAENSLEYVSNGNNSLKIQKISASVGDKFVLVDDEKISFEHKIINVNNIIRVPISFVKKMGMKIEGITSYYGTTYHLSMENPSYIPEESDVVPSGNWFYQLLNQL